ncbi:hypothetical protein N7466_003758 [Penicillium verhagenii]|uniref:uncharacterized protein n=1 Tax=Penicillium verhagenii TaxID=1562060 RepID=UPI0025456E43|nr:uncharacterized protein N7466_003758 [Penicillium verhagenii]KAJ5934211.1 hypothetical protein N7466_003758 [Penicillium verhagenii]
MTSPAALGRLASTTVHIQMIPTPRKLRDTRQILAALQKFGEVTTFRNLKYDQSNRSPNQHRPVIAIFDSPDAAQRALASSPMIVTLDSPSTSTSQPSTSTSTGTGTSTDTGATSKSPPSSSLESKKKYKNHDPIFDNVASGTIKCIIEPSTHNHETAMPRNKYFATFYPNKEDPVYKDMNSPQTGVPLHALGDVLQSRKPKLTLLTHAKAAGVRRALGGESIMAMWREANDPKRAAKVKYERGP